MSKEISNTDDTIDARAVEDRIAELEFEISSAVMADNDLSDEQWDELSNPEKEEKINAWAAKGNQSDVDDLRSLQAFGDEIDDSAIRNHETMIREDHFETYARELAEDLEGKAVRDAQWPFNCIDWEKAANELKQDYTSADWDGVTYYYRS